MFLQPYGNLLLSLILRSYLAWFVAGYYLKDIPVQTRSLRLDNSNVQQFKLEKFHLTDEDIPDPLQFVEGHKLTFYLVAFD